MSRALIWSPLLYMGILGLLLCLLWSKLDNQSATAIIAVLAGGLAGVLGSYAGTVQSSARLKQESTDRLKSFASEQALELTKLEFDLRSASNEHRDLLAPAKVYREFYKALFALYTTREWPREIQELGLLDVLKRSGGAISTEANENTSGSA